MVTKNLAAGVLLTYLLECQLITDDKYVISSDHVVCSTLHLGHNEVFSARNTLRALKFIETKKSGFPPKTHYKCNIVVILKAVEDFLNTSEFIDASTSLRFSRYIQQRNNNNVNKNIDINTKSKSRSKSKASESTTTERTEKVFTEDDIEFQLAKVLLNQILKRRPNYFGDTARTPAQKKTKCRNWAKSMDYMLRIDRRDPEEALDILLWSQKDPFWQKVITSPYKLREKYGQLQEIREEKISSTKAPADPHSNITLELKRLFVDKFLPGKAPTWTVDNQAKFIRTSRRIAGFAKKSGLKVENIPGYLVGCLKKYMSDHGNAVYPGNLCSDTTWNIQLPQYLKELGIVENIKND
jgi:hypothetical protein